MLRFVSVALLLACALGLLGCPGKIAGDKSQGETNKGDDAPPCTADTSLDCSTPGTQGFQCSVGEGPSALDPELTCSTPTPDGDGVHDDYCCSAPSSSSGPPPLGCTVDTTIACDGPANGFSCSAGSNPQTGNPLLACTTPYAQSGSDSYCCFPYGTASDHCVPDDTLASLCPDRGSYPFRCDPGDTPPSFDPVLECSQGVTDADGVHDDYCCDLP